MIEDFALSDYLETPSLTFLWCLITFIGFVVMMATLIAVINTSYERSRSSSIILFRKARCEFVASNAAIEGFLRPEFFKPGSQLKCSPGNAGLAVARWILLFVFFITIAISSLFLVQRVVESIRAGNIASAIASLLLCVIMAFNVWSTLVFIVATIAACCGKFGQRIKQCLFSINQFCVNIAATMVFGIDVKNADTCEGELIDITGEGKYERELCDRIDRLEKTLERVLASRVEAELEDVPAAET